jgi:hypothetical protein
MSSHEVQDNPNIIKNYIDVLEPPLLPPTRPVAAPIPESPGVVDDSQKVFVHIPLRTIASEPKLSLLNP